MGRTDLFRLEIKFTKWIFHFFKVFFLFFVSSLFFVDSLSVASYSDVDLKEEFPDLFEDKGDDFGDDDVAGDDEIMADIFQDLDLEAEKRTQVDEFQELIERSVNEANEFMADREMEKRKKKKKNKKKGGGGGGGLKVPISGTIHVCFFCDKECQREVEKHSDGKTSKEWFDDVADLITDAYQASGIDLEVENEFVMKTKLKLALKKYTKKKGKEGLPDASKNFWENKQKLFDRSRKKVGCDVAFLVSPTNDPFWKTCPKSGVSYKFQMCTAKAYGLVNLYEEDKNKQAALVAHEMGHLFGMGHDDEDMEESFNRMAAVPQYKKYVTDVLKYCAAGADRGCSDPAGRCLMDSAPASAPYPKSFSKCSQAYMKYWSTLPGGMYDSSCVKEDKDKLEAPKNT